MWNVSKYYDMIQIEEVEIVTCNDKHKFEEAIK